MCDDEWAFVDTGNNPNWPIVFEVSDATVEEDEDEIMSGNLLRTTEPAVLLSFHPEIVLHERPSVGWRDVFESGKVDVRNMILGPWGACLDRKSSRALGINMETLIGTGLTWEIIKETDLPPDWFVEVARAKLRDIENIPGNLKDIPWTKDDIESALNLPFGTL